jgi:hypothetical protein
LTISRTQAVANSGTGSAVLTITAPTAGNLLIVGIGNTGAKTAIVTPTGYTAVDPGYDNAGANPAVKMFYRIADGTEGTSLTCTGSAGGKVRAALAEYNSTNGAFSAPSDQSNGAGVASGASIASGSITPTGTEFVAVVVLNLATTAVTVGPSFTNSFTSRATADSGRVALADQIVTGGSGSYSTTASWTATTNSGAAIAIANFKEPAAGGGGQSRSPSSLGSASAFGAVTAVPGGVSAAPSGLGSAGAFGVVTVNGSSISVPVSALASAAAFGSITPVPGGTVIAVPSLGSAGAFGALSPAGGTPPPVSGSIRRWRYRRT